MIDFQFWHNKRVFLTGHTGFKGSWLCLWLHHLGVNLTGYALEPPTKPSLFELANIDKLMNSTIGDIRDIEDLSKTMVAADPEIVIHMAAQPLVRESYNNPSETYAINVMGTVNLFEAVRCCKNVKAVINVTTDKCYENKEWIWGYRENEALGGYDPYSNSKACSELVTASYRDSFFNPKDYATHGVGIASVRAGNVIGGGDWADDRLVPDIVRTILKGDKVSLRNPHAIRPWQYVLEPLSGYLMLAQRLYENGVEFSEAWNFGPNESDAKTVEWIVKRFSNQWGTSFEFNQDTGHNPHEANYLKLDSAKARNRLQWYPKWNIEQAIDRIVEWYKIYTRDGGDTRTICLQQIEDYLNN